MPPRVPTQIVVEKDPKRPRYVVRDRKTETGVTQFSAKATEFVIFTNETDTTVQLDLPNGFLEGDGMMLGPGDKAVLRVRLHPSVTRVFEYGVFIPLANMAAEGNSAPKMIVDP